MSKQQYAWMLGLVAAWRQSCPDDDQGESLCRAMEAVFGVAGLLRPHERQAANDLAAALFILQLIWVLNGANNRANLVKRGPFLRELTPAANPTPNPAQAAWLLLYTWLAWFSDQCHSDHLPTSDVRQAVALSG